MWPYQWITDSVLGITDSVLPTQYYRSRESLWETAESIRSIAIINCLIRFQNTNLPNTQFARLICLRLPEWITVGDDCFARSVGRPCLGHAHQSAFLKKSSPKCWAWSLRWKGILTWVSQPDSPTNIQAPYIFCTKENERVSQTCSCTVSVFVIYNVNNWTATTDRWLAKQRNPWLLRLKQQRASLQSSVVF